MDGTTLIDRALIVDTPWIDYILDDAKAWEMRSRSTNVRGRIGLIASRTGRVAGVTTVVDSLGPFGREQLAEHPSKHKLPTAALLAGKFDKWNRAWVLDGSIRLPTPVPYIHPQGAVIWVKLDPQCAAAVTEAVDRLKV